MFALQELGNNCTAKHLILRLIRRGAKRRGAEKALSTEGNGEIVTVVAAVAVGSASRHR